MVSNTYDLYSSVMKTGSPNNFNNQDGELLKSLNADQSFIPVEQQMFDSNSSSSSTKVLTLSGSYEMNDVLNIKMQDFVRQEEQASDQKPFRQTTLEKFLIGGTSTVNDLGQNVGVSQSLLDHVIQPHADWMHYQLGESSQMTLFGSNLPVFGNGVVSGGFTENQPTSMSMAMVMPTSSDTQSMEITRSEETTDKSIERRQKRMIKNRESAARSRMKKQAYIHELETQVNKLKKENDDLRKQKVNHFAVQDGANIFSEVSSRNVYNVAVLTKRSRSHLNTFKLHKHILKCSSYLNTFKLHQAYPQYVQTAPILKCSSYLNTFKPRQAYPQMLQGNNQRLWP